MELNTNYILEIIENGNDEPLEIIVINPSEKFKLLSCKAINVTGFGVHVADTNGDLYELDYLITVYIDSENHQYNSIQISDVDDLYSSDNTEVIQPNALILLVDVQTNEPVKKEPIKGKVTNQLK